MPVIGKDALGAHKTTHQNGGSDEISVAGLSGALADSQPAAAHNTSHQNGGSDEISVAGLSGALADAQTPSAHNTSHQNGGSDEISVAGLSGALADAQTPSAHNTSHQNGGSDEISVAGLSGALADAQTPSAHNTSHQNGGSDEISVAGLSGVLADPQTPIDSLIGEGHVNWFAYNYFAIIQGTFAFNIEAGQALNYQYYNSSNAQNDQIDYKVWLAAGTYNFKTLTRHGPNQADRTVLIDGVSIGVLNAYSAATVQNVLDEINGVVIATSGLKTMSFKAASRHASSGGWFMSLCSGVWYRTA